MMKNLLFTLIILSLSSCAFHSGTMNSNASLGSNNFEIIDLVSVQSSTKKIFGFGGLAKEALVLDAKKKLYLKYPLKRGQVFANISVDFQDKTILMVNETTVTLSADVVQFDSVGTNNQKLFEDLKKTESQAASDDKSTRYIVCGNEAFAIREKVFYSKGSEIFSGEIKSISNGLVLIYNENESIEIEPNVVYHKISIEKQSNERISLNGKELIGAVVGKNSERAVFKSEESQLILLTKEQSKRIFEE